MAGFAKYPVVTVLRAEDLERARRFYTDVMGYELEEEDSASGTAYLRAGESTAVMLYERPGLPAPQNTTLGIGLPKAEFDSCVEYLRSKGVALEDYDIPEIGLKTVDGVAPMGDGKTAWFTDTEGNIINIATV